MKEAIQTKTLPTTKTKGLRIKAWCTRGKITRKTDDLEDQSSVHLGGASIQAHRLVARELLDKFQDEDIAEYGGIPQGRKTIGIHHWLYGSSLVTGQLSSGNYCHVIHEVL